MGGVQGSNGATSRAVDVAGIIGHDVLSTAIDPMKAFIERAPSRSRCDSKSLVGVRSSCPIRKPVPRHTITSAGAGSSERGRIGEGSRTKTARNGHPRGSAVRTPSRMAAGSSSSKTSAFPTGTRSCACIRASANRGACRAGVDCSETSSDVRMSRGKRQPSVTTRLLQVSHGDRTRSET